MKNKDLGPPFLAECMNDRDLMRDLVLILRRECPVMLMRIETAINEANPKKLEEASHRLKGSVLHFSAAKAAALAGKLEEMGKTHSMQGACQIFAKLSKEVGSLLDTLNVPDPPRRAQ